MLVESELIMSKINSLSKQRNEFEDKAIQQLAFMNGQIKALQELLEEPPVSEQPSEN